METTYTSHDDVCGIRVEYRHGAKPLPGLLTLRTREGGLIETVRQERDFIVSISGEIMCKSLDIRGLAKGGDKYLICGTSSVPDVKCALISIPLLWGSSSGRQSVAAFTQKLSKWICTLLG